MEIHPTAIVHPKAELGSGVKVGPYSAIAEDVSVGDHTEIGSHVVVRPYTTIGKNCRIYQFSSIGEIPQDLKFQGERTDLIIGDSTVIREFVTINRGTAGGGGATRIGEKNLIMAYAHIAHDCVTGNNVIMSNCATLGGHIEIGDYAALGGLVAVHQFVRIGAYAFIGGKSAITKDVPPYTLAAGDRARLYGLNVVGLRRRGFPPEVISALKKTYRHFFRSGSTLKAALQTAPQELPNLEEVRKFIEFIAISRRGITR